MGVKRQRTTTSDIESVLNEQRSFAPPLEFVAQARLRAEELDPVGFWAALARSHLRWHRPFTVTLDESDAPNYRWFSDGELNVSHNCLDVHLVEHGHKTAIIFEGEPGDLRRLSYRELHSVVFGGFSAVALRDRIEDAEATLVITADGGWRGGNPVPLKAAVDAALREGAGSAQAV